MANRRMFSLKIIDSAKFLKMPPSTQSLYFHLSMRADDDGIVEAYNVIRVTGSTEDDLRVLASKKYIRILNDDLVTYICDWHEHNLIRPDRKIDSIYKDLLIQVLPDVSIIEKRPRADVKLKSKALNNDGQTMDGQRTDNGRHRLGKVRLGKDSIDKDNIIYTASDEAEKTNSTKKPKKHKYGEYNNVLLTDDELQKLKDKFFDWESKIENLSQGIEMKGYKYKNHYLAILKWAENEKKGFNKDSPVNIENESPQSDGIDWDHLPGVTILT